MLKNGKQTKKEIILSYKDKLENEWKDLTYDEVRKHIFNETGVEVYTSYIAELVGKYQIKVGARKINRQRINMLFQLTNAVNGKTKPNWRGGH